MGLVNLTLAMINLLGYIKCQKNHKAAMSSFLMRKAKENISADQMQKIGSMAAEQVMKQQL